MAIRFIDFWDILTTLVLTLRREGSFTTQVTAMREMHPYVRLRKIIRQAGRQFRNSDDTSKSLFHPTRGFVYGYDVEAVESALNAFEATLSSEYLPTPESLTAEEALLQEANLICAGHPSLEEAQEFAANVVSYLQQKPATGPRLEFVESGITVLRRSAE